MDIDPDVERWRRRFEHDRLGAVILATDGTIRWANPAAEMLLGRRVEEWTGRSAFEVVHPEDVPKALASFSQLRNHTGPRGPNQFRILGRDGAAIPVEYRGDNLVDDPDVGAFVVHLRPLSHRAAAEDLAATELELLSAVVDGRPVRETLAGVVAMAERWWPDRRMAVQLIEDGTLSTAAAPSLPDSLVGLLNGRSVTGDDHVSSQALARADAAIATDVARETSSEFRTELRQHGFGSWWSVVIPATSGDAAAIGTIDLFGLPVGAPEPEDWTFLYLIAHLASLVADRALDATAVADDHDPTTGASTARRFSDVLSNEIDRSRRSDALLAVIVLDLDHFHTINSRLGIAAGDELLQQVSSRLRSALRATDQLARLSADRFAVLCADLQRVDEVPAVADRLLAAFAQPFSLHGSDWLVQATAGVSLLEPGADGDALVQQATSAMTRGKTTRRGQWTMADTNLSSRVAGELDRSAAVNARIEAGALELHLRPLVGARGSDEGRWATVRWAGGEDSEDGDVWADAATVGRRGRVLSLARDLVVDAVAELDGSATLWLVLPADLFTTGVWDESTGSLATAVTSRIGLVLDEAGLVGPTARMAADRAGGGRRLAIGGWGRIGSLTVARTLRPALIEPVDELLDDDPDYVREVVRTLGATGRRVVVDRHRGETLGGLDVILRD